MGGIFRAASVSWKTSLIGVLIFIEVLSQNLRALLDDLPETTADWNMVIVAGTAMIGMLIARDADKKSEEHVEL